MAETTTTGGASVILQPFERKVKRPVITVRSTDLITAQVILGHLCAFAGGVTPATVIVNGEASTIEFE